ncbi:IS110 family transposase [Bradyrhizobium sp. 197]|uniref:IS110 family transposase n=1 Tax=Bradyrhizobium sp. 197 TaxID=2782663 RepID=UPI001FF97F9E|nr:IS110 family transposase [Bradyrhizobium sp. 197]
MLGEDISTIDGLGPYLSLKLIAECGDDLSSWPSAKHFTSWLGLAPSNKISGGKMLSSRTRRSGGRAAALLRLAAVTVGRTLLHLGTGKLSGPPSSYRGRALERQAGDALASPTSPIALEEIWQESNFRRRSE